MRTLVPGGHFAGMRVRAHAGTVRRREFILTICSGLKFSLTQTLRHACVEHIIKSNQWYKWTIFGFFCCWNLAASPPARTLSSPSGAAGTHAFPSILLQSQISVRAKRGGTNPKGPKKFSMPKDKRQSVTEDVTEIVWILVLYQAGVPAVVIGAVTNISRETVRVLGHSSLNSLRKCPPPPPQILNFGQGSVVDTRGVP